MHHRYAVIMAGGVGERFWPLSRRSRPKQLLKLTRPDQTLLEEAVIRIEPLVDKESIIVATSKVIEAPIRKSGIVPENQIIVEPDKRNTLGCLVWVSAHLIARHGQGMGSNLSIAVLTADHRIGDPDIFRQTVGHALETAERQETLVTIGITPTRPETGYGYIEQGDGPRGGAKRVLSFREKPNRQTAEEFLSTGRFLWNSGMFFWTLDTFLAELELADPDSHQITLDIANFLVKGNIAAAESRFKDLPDRPIDIALIERTRNIYTIRAHFDWDDLGAWTSLDRSFPHDDDGNVIQGTGILPTETHHTIILNESKSLTIATLGLENFVVVATDDAILICPKSESQRVREIVAKLPEELK